jgi:hypothetical protein
MHRSVLTLLLAATLVAGCSAPPTDTPTASSTSATATTTASPTDDAGMEWKTHTSEKGAYTVEMPGEAKENEDSAPTNAGEIKFYSATVEGPNYGYTAAYSDFPEAAVTSQKPDKMLEGARDGALKNINGKVEKTEMIEVQGNPAIEFSFAVPDQKMKGKARMILVKYRLYQLIAGQEESAYKEADLDKFLGSFKLQE